MEEGIPSPFESGIRQKKTTRFKNLPQFAEACENAGVSDCKTALLSTYILNDVGLKQQNSPDNIIDR